MDAARAAVSKITGRTGHRTDVDEVVNPAVVQEVIKPHRHEEVQEAIDREVHQDHYHTTVQPITHRETLPEKHVHNLLPEVNREIRHDNERETTQRVQAELAQFKNTQTIHEVSRSQAAAPTVTGEHVHHHVHETVQPIIQKETIQPEVVHTVIPIHETHHAGAQHHGISALPMKTLDEFTRSGGSIKGSQSHSHEEYEGAPRPYNEKLKTTIENVLPGHHSSHSTTSSGLTGTTGTSSHHTGGLTGSSGHHDRDLTGTSGSHTGGLTGSSRDHNSGLTGTSGSHHTSGLGNDRLDSGVGHSGHRDTEKFGTTGTSSSHKPSMMDKLNPKVDANGDGKAGFMK